MKQTKRQNRPTKPMQSTLVQIEKPIYGGSFLARVEGKATFIPLTLPGEQVRARIVEEKRSYAAAEPEEIVLAAAGRITPSCRHFGECGGCQYQHADYGTQLSLKQAILRETLARGGVEAPEKIDVLAGDPWKYRNRIRVAVDAEGRVGYRGRRSHHIVPIHECPIAAPLLVRAALSAGEIFRSNRRAPRPTEIALFCNADETDLLASVFVRDSRDEGFDPFIREWNNQVAELVGIEFVLQGERTDLPRTLHRWGKTSLIYGAGGIDYRVDHSAFFQVNRWLIDSLVDRVVGDRRGALAWDLFAGVGLFARRLAAGFESVVAVEAAPAASQALTWNLKGTTGTSVDADTLAFLKKTPATPKPDLIVVDPPRTGLGPDVTAFLAGVAAPCLIYVSCDPATLARDLRKFIDAGYAPHSVTLADLFPQTFHLETVVELRRS